MIFIPREGDRKFGVQYIWSPERVGQMYQPPDYCAELVRNMLFTMADGVRQEGVDFIGTLQCYEVPAVFDAGQEA